MRLLLVGAFAYPHAQGSQVYFQEQAIALRAAGAEVELLTYGPRRGPESGSPALAPDGSSVRPPPIEDPERWRALDGFVAHALPAWSVPSSGRSGPRPGKPFADLWLALALRRVVAAAGHCSPSPGASSSASGSASSAGRDVLHDASSSASSSAIRASLPGRDARPEPSPQTFDAILAHHAEAALLALHALPGPRPPVVYCAHTLLEQELPEYFKSPRRKIFSSPQSRDDGPEDEPTPTAAAHWAEPPSRSAGLEAIAAFGRVLDRRIAARADGWIALTQSSSRVISASSPAPGRRLGPPIPDPELDAERPDCQAVARAHGLEPGGFFLYTGNLDPYQDLPVLAQVARGRPARAAGGRRATGPSSGSLPIVIATHDARAERLAAQAAAVGGAGLVVRRMRTAAEARALLGAARASLVPRRTLGGFPIKLANSLAAGTPVVALHGEEWGLVEGRDALIGAVGDPVASIAQALERLEQDPALAARLGAGARATWRTQHDPARMAAETLDLVEALRRRR